MWSVHPLFVLIMLASVLTGYFGELITLFLIVFVHELGHVAAGQAFGWKFRVVRLLPFGGVAEVENGAGVSAKQEACVAIMGPLQNVWMGLLALLLGKLGWWDASWAAYVWQANLMIGLFNLLPIHPLDGGRLLQAALSYSLNYYSMMVWTARVSMLLSLGMIIYAMMPLLLEGRGPQANLCMVGFFLLISNWTYYRNIPYVFFRFLMSRAEAAVRHSGRGAAAQPIVVHRRQSLSSVTRLFWRERYHLIYVRGDNGGIMHVLPEEELVDDYLQGGNPNRAVFELFR